MAKARKPTPVSPFGDIRTVQLLPEEWGHVRRILAVRLDNIGDVIMLGPALRALRDNLPAARITLMASPSGNQTAPLLPWVDDVIVWRAVWQDVSGDLPLDPARELELVATLKKNQFDAAIVFTSFSQSPYPPAYACYLAGIPIRLGHSKEFGGSLLTHWFKPPPKSGHQVDRNLALLEQAGFTVQNRELELHVLPEVQARAELLLQEVGVAPTTPFILLAPGASCAARRYDLQRYAVVARSLSAEAGLPLVIAGSGREFETLQSVISIADQESVISLVGRTSVPELAAIVRRASLVLANNSACLHLADAFQRPMVITYSGTEHESQWRPRSSPARLLRRDTLCSPCYNFNCPYGMECLDISPEEVVQAALDLLFERQSQAT